MSNYATLKAAIQSAVYTNGNNEITGAGLQAVLLQIVDTVGDGYIFKGVATAGTTPGTPDANVFYIAPAGTYTNFGGSHTVPEGSIGVFTWNGSQYSLTSVKTQDVEVFDISAYNNNAKYADLADALNGGANIPQNLRKGGIIVKFIQNSDNKYVQYRLMSDTWSTNTEVWAISEEGVLVENSEYIYVKADAENKILWAIKTDGSIYYGAGVPKQIIDYIDNKLAGLSLDEYDDIVAFLSDYLGNDTTLKVLIDGINERIPELVENPEWLDVKTDNDGKVLEGINKRGEKIFGVMPPQIKEYVDEEIGKASENSGDFVILNPYDGIASKVRQRAISHEHIKTQEVFEAAINRGIDILCISNYTPGVPAYPAEGFSTDYVEWEFVKDSNEDIIYERYDDGTIKTKLLRNNVEYKVPALKRVVKTLTGGFTDFTKENGERCVVSDLTQLPNAEHAHYTLAREWEAGGLHINFIGSTWAESVNGNPEDAELAADIAKFNQENGYNFNMQTFHAAYPLWSLQDVLVHTQYNWLYQQLIFGTINHPGFTGMRYWQVDELMKTASRFLKGMEIYNNGETPAQAEYSINFYDEMLMRGYEFWCLAVDDWGNPNQEYNPNNPERRGCNLMYLPSNYNSMGKSAKRKAVIEAYFSGSFAAAGYGLDIDIASVNVQGAEIIITFNQVPDKTIIDIDGVRTEGGAVQTLRATATADNTFIRFEAYKDDDFLFTQPFYIKKK